MLHRIVNVSNQWQKTDDKLKSFLLLQLVK